MLPASPLRPGLGDLEDTSCRLGKPWGAAPPNKDASGAPYWAESQSVVPGDLGMIRGEENGAQRTGGREEGGREARAAGYVQGSEAGSRRGK